MWKFIILILLLYVVYRMFANDYFRKRKEAAAEEKAEADRKIAAGEMVRDPECGTYVSVDDSISVKSGDRVWYFCGYECRDKFLKRLESGDEGKLPGTEEKE